MATSGEGLREDVLEGFSFAGQAFEEGPLLNQEGMCGAEGADRCGEGGCGGLSLGAD